MQYAEQIIWGSGSLTFCWMFRSIIWWACKLMSRLIFAGKAAVIAVTTGEIPEQRLLWSPEGRARLC
jgi:hypothetical protein